MRCPSCQFENPAGMKFCGQCGVAMARRCPGCEAEVPEGFRFCGSCGQALEGEAGGAGSGREPESEVREELAARRFRSAAEGELKQVTVVEGVLELEGGELSAEARHRAFDRCLQLVETTVERYGGSVRLGGGAQAGGWVAVFGAVQAFEDHARRGVMAVLDLRRELVREASGVEVRCGVASGEAVTGGSAQLVVGSPAEGASRLCRQAVSGELRVDPGTARLVRGLVELEEVPGHGEGVGLLLLGLRSGATSHRLGRCSTLSPFVGRDRELAVLRELLQEARDGRGQVVGIAGEAGAGKTRLLHELFHEELLRGEPGLFPSSSEDGEGIAVAGDLPEGSPASRFGRRRAGAAEPAGSAEELVHLQGRCLSYGRGTPYLPIQDMIRRLAGIGPDHSAEETEGRLRQSLGELGVEVEEVVPYLLRLLGLEGARGSDGALLDDLEPKALQARTFRALRRMIFDAGRSAPVVVEIEDFHWIDATSEELLASLVESLAAARVLLVLTYRSGHGPRWMDRSHATQVSLRRLPDGEARRIVEALYAASSGAGSEGPIPDLSSLLEKAQGNPFFLEELGRVWAESGDGEGDGEVPDTVQDLLMARIDRLPEAHRRLLRTASVLDRELPTPLLSALWSEASGPEVAGREAGLESLLQDLRRWELLDTQPAGEGHRFKHALTQEVAYGSLLESRRRELHRIAAEALERLHGDRLDEVLEQLVHHWPKAGDRDKTVQYLTRFAERAVREYAHAEAVEALLEALEHLDPSQVPAGAEAAGRQAERRQLERRSLELLPALAESLVPLARFDQSLEVLLRYDRAVDRLEEGDLGLAAAYHFWLAHTYSYLGNQPEARRLALEAVSEAQGCGDEAIEGRARYVMARDDFWAGQFRRGARESLQAVVLLERAGQVWWQGQAHWVAGFHHFLLGELDQAFDQMAVAANIGAALEDARLDPSWSLGYFHAALGQWTAGITACRKGLLRAEDPLNRAAALGFLGYAYLGHGNGHAEGEGRTPPGDAGDAPGAAGAASAADGSGSASGPALQVDLQTALETLEQAYLQMVETGMQPLQSWFGTFLAEAYRRDGRLELAEAQAEESRGTSQAVGFRLGTALAVRCLGLIRETEQPGSGRALLEEALAAFEELEASLEAARTRLDLGEAWAGEDLSRARAELEAGCQALEGLGARHTHRLVEEAIPRARRSGIELRALGAGRGQEGGPEGEARQAGEASGERRTAS